MLAIGAPTMVATAATPEHPTFSRDVAPIIYHHCAGCHRPGKAAPFSLFTYEDVRKRAKQIAEVTGKRFMPPWMPEPGVNEFVNARVLDTNQISILERWHQQGSPPGDPADLPPLPSWPEGWQLGKPDLVVNLDQPFLLPAEGKDVYRNFAIAVPIQETRHIRGVEFSPGNARLVHHAFIRVDPTSDSRRLDAQDPEPGFSGIHTPRSAQSPEGFFLSWQPGKTPSFYRPGMAWPLEKGSDLVLQLHLQPSGKVEEVRPSIALYFSDQPATRKPTKLWLSSYAIDIPAGDAAYVLEDSYRLPADVEVMSILPHAHFLGRDMQAEATLPDGTKRRLLSIRQWDFNWQGDYQYVEPLFLPSGTTISMRFTYDNSAGNPRNPNSPPQRVRYGLQSSEEMGELWLQVLPRTEEGARRLESDARRRTIQDVIAYNEYLLRLNPADAVAHTELGKARLASRAPEQAREHFLAALRLDPKLDEPHYFLGLILRSTGREPEAREEFQAALKANPQNFKAHGNLGLMAMEAGQLGVAEQHFKQALAIHPGDTIARESLAEIEKARGGRK